MLFYFVFIRIPIICILDILWLLCLLDKILSFIIIVQFLRHFLPLFLSHFICLFHFYISCSFFRVLPFLISPLLLSLKNKINFSNFLLLYFFLKFYQHIFYSPFSVLVSFALHSYILFVIFLPGEYGFIYLFILITVKFGITNFTSSRAVFFWVLFKKKSIAIRWCFTFF